MCLRTCVAHSHVLFNISILVCRHQHLLSVTPSGCDGYPAISCPSSPRLTALGCFGGQSRGPASHRADLERGNKHHSPGSGSSSGSGGGRRWGDGSSHTYTGGHLTRSRRRTAHLSDDSSSGPRSSDRAADQCCPAEAGRSHGS